MWLIESECVIEPKEATGSLRVTIAVVGPRFSFSSFFFPGACGSLQGCIDYSIGLGLA